MAEDVGQTWDWQFFPFSTLKKLHHFQFAWLWKWSLVYFLSLYKASLCPLTVFEVFSLSGHLNNLAMIHILVWLFKFYSVWGLLSLLDMWSHTFQQILIAEILRTSLPKTKKKIATEFVTQKVTSHFSKSNYSGVQGTMYMCIRF
jgi:hypothetical protein